MNASRNPVAVWLRGTSQVFFMQNAFTGILFFLAIGYASYASGSWATTIGAVIGVIVATITARLIGSDDDAITTGLYGFNGVLVGVALPTFVAVSPALWVYVIVGAAVSAVVTAAFSAILTDTWKIPGSTGPFVLTSWLLAASAYSFGDLSLPSLKPGLATDYVAGMAAMPSLVEGFQIFLRNIGQVFLLGSAVSGALILIGIFIASWRAGVAAAAGSLLAMIVAISLDANPHSVSQGLYGYSAVLTALALSVVFLQPSGKVILYAALGTIFTVLVQGAFDVFVLPDGLPSFTAPYVLVMYLFMAPRALMAPHPHEPTNADHPLQKS